MAFVKRTWLARIGTGLNKFIIGEKDANNKQTLVNSPDSISQQGDVISADNLNDLENRIYNEFSSQSTRIDGKQDTLTFDDAPTSGSNNPVKSGGVYSSIEGLKLTKIWQNPNTAVGYSNSSFQVSTTSNEFIIAFAQEAETYPADLRMILFHCRIGVGDTMSAASPFSVSMSAIASGTLTVYTRNFTIYPHSPSADFIIENEAEISISSGSVTSQSDNTRMIPVAIYEVGNIYTT